MSEASDSPGDVRALAEQAGLSKAFHLAPDIVAACVERGMQPLTQQPPSPLTTPAPIFEPVGFEPKK